MLLAPEFVSNPIYFSKNSAAVYYLIVVSPSMIFFSLHARYIQKCMKRKFLDDSATRNMAKHERFVVQIELSQKKVDVIDLVIKIDNSLTLLTLFEWLPSNVCLPL